MKTIITYCTLSLVLIKTILAHGSLGLMHIKIILAHYSLSFHPLFMELQRESHLSWIKLHGYIVFMSIDGNMGTKNDVEREHYLIRERNLLQTIIGFLQTFKKPPNSCWATAREVETGMACEQISLDMVRNQWTLMLANIIKIVETCHR